MTATAKAATRKLSRIFRDLQKEQGHVTDGTRNGYTAALAALTVDWQNYSRKTMGDIAIFDTLAHYGIAERQFVDIMRGKRCIGAHIQFRIAA